MSEPDDPKGPPGPPVEGPTRAFRFKIDGWMNDLLDDPLKPEEAPPGPLDETLPGLAPPPPDQAAPKPTEGG